MGTSGGRTTYAGSMGGGDAGGRAAHYFIRESIAWACSCVASTARPLVRRIAARVVGEIRRQMGAEVAEVPGMALSAAVPPASKSRTRVVEVGKARGLQVRLGLAFCICVYHKKHFHLHVLILVLEPKLST